MAVAEAIRCPFGEAVPWTCAGGTYQPAETGRRRRRQGGVGRARSGDLDRETDQEADDPKRCWCRRGVRIGPAAGAACGIERRLPRSREGSSKNGMGRLHRQPRSTPPFPTQRRSRPHGENTNGSNDMTETHDLDPIETREWLDSVEDVIDRDGADARALPARPGGRRARARGANLPFGATTAYVNTIPVDQQAPFPGDVELEWRIRTINRWNAMATVVRRNKVSSEYGGHIASFASSAVLYDIGLNYFWRTRTDKHGGDLVFFQGHAVPGHLRALVHGGADQRGDARQLPLRDRRQGPQLLSAPLADARLLAVPHRLDGARAADGDLPGAVHEIHAQPRPYRHGRPQGLGLPRRRRDGRAREPRRHRAGGARGPRQPDLRGQLQPAAPRRAGARQRQDHPGARGHLPRRRLERDQADLGHRLGRAARPRRHAACCAG